MEPFSSGQTASTGQENNDEYVQRLEVKLQVLEGALRSMGGGASASASTPYGYGMPRNFPPTSTAFAPEGPRVFYSQPVALPPMPTGPIVVGQPRHVFRSMPAAYGGGYELQGQLATAQNLAQATTMPGTTKSALPPTSGVWSGSGPQVGGTVVNNSLLQVATDYRSSAFYEQSATQAEGEGDVAATMFRLMDKDGDGVVSREDFREFIRRNSVGLLAKKEPEPERTHFYNQFMGRQMVEDEEEEEDEELLLDIDRLDAEKLFDYIDRQNWGYITREGFIKACMMRGLIRDTDVRIKQMDDEGNLVKEKSYSRPKVCSKYKAPKYGVSEQEASQLFDEIERNDENCVDTEEWQRHLKTRGHSNEGRGMATEECSIM